jgi:hypothetical protein
MPQAPVAQRSRAKAYVLELGDDLMPMPLHECRDVALARETP